jgi:dTDP-glucose 4,6-dehydratase
VIHGAASSDAAIYAERPAEMLETIVSGTRRVLEFAPTAGASNLLYVSSGAVYGRQPPDVSHVPETYREHSAAHATASPYAEGKRAAEALCLEASTQKGLGIKIARAFAFVGPHLPLDTHFAAGNFLRDALGGSEITVAGDGMPFRSYLHMADLVVWLVTILTRGESMRPYNVGSDEAISIEALARETARLRQPAVPVRISRRPDGRPAERYVPDVERARRELGLEVRISLHEALERTFRWLQAAPC